MPVYKSDFNTTSDMLAPVQIMQARYNADQADARHYATLGAQLMEQAATSADPEARTSLSASAQNFIRASNAANPGKMDAEGFYHPANIMGGDKHDINQQILIQKKKSELGYQMKYDPTQLKAKYLANQLSGEEIPAYTYFLAQEANNNLREYQKARESEAQAIQDYSRIPTDSPLAQFLMAYNSSKYHNAQNAINKYAPNLGQDEETIKQYNLGAMNDLDKQLRGRGWE